MFITLSWEKESHLLLMSVSSVRARLLAAPALVGGDTVVRVDMELLDVSGDVKGTVCAGSMVWDWVVSQVYGLSGSKLKRSLSW